MKYKALLEGLEATEVTFLSLKKVIDYRIEAEYFNRKFLEVDEKFSAIESVYFTDIASFVNGRPYNSERFNAISGISIAKIGDVTNKRDIENWEFVDKDEFVLQKGQLLCNGNILMTLTGDPPDVGKVNYIYKPTNASWNQRVAKIQLKSGQKAFIGNDVLFATLSAETIRIQLERYAKGIRQRNLGNESLERLLLPVIPCDAQLQIQNCVQKAYSCYDNSKQLYSEAEAYLLECLGMTDFAANPDAYNVKTLKESFLETGRFDAEYYLPKYEDYCRLVQSYANGYEPLGDVCNIKDTNYIPEEDVRYKYIELANIGKSGEITGCDIQDGEDLPTRARRLVHQGDVIVSSIEGSLESCALVTDDYDGALCSTGFYVLQSSKLNSETLLTLFKSLPMQQLMKKGCSGTILTAISKPELEKLPVPIIRQEVQEEIAQHVQKSFALRKEAMQLLENAKITVEQVIENGGGNLLIFNKLQEQAIREERLAAWLLLTEFGMLPTTKKENKTVKTCKKLSDSFLSSGRLDAEYYQPKYDYLFSHLSEFATSTIRELTEIRKSIEPGSDAYEETGVPFIRVSDMSKFGLSDTTIHLNAEDYRDVIRPQKDTILLSKDGSVGIAYKVEEPLDVITSGAILHLSLKSTDVLPDYLTLVLNSPIVRLQAERDAGGSIIQHWKPLEIENVVIPILPMQIQQEIADKIRSSFKLRKESQHLLDEAKRMVEVAIEGIA